MYLQQHTRYTDNPSSSHPQIQQPHQSHLPGREQQELKHQQFLTIPKYRERVKQPTHIFVLSSTVAPHDATATPLPSIHPSQSPHFSPKYPQRNRPVHHPAYAARPELDSSSNVQQNLQNNEAYSSASLSPSSLPQSQSQLPLAEQILTIPVHSLFSDLQNYQHNHYASQASPPASQNLQHQKLKG